MMRFFALVFFLFFFLLFVLLLFTSSSSSSSASSSFFFFLIISHFFCSYPLPHLGSPAFLSHRIIWYDWEFSSLRINVLLKISVSSFLSHCSHGANALWFFFVFCFVVYVSRLFALPPSPIWVPPSFSWNHMV